MEAQNTQKEKKKKSDKTFSMQFSFLATLIFTMLSITIFIGGLCIYEVDHYIQAQAEEYVNVISDNEGSQINDSLRNMEKSVNIMESYLMDFFTSEADVEDAELLENVIKRADQMFIDVAEHTSAEGAVSYYVRLDPSISDSKAGLFYSKINGSSEFASLEPTDLAIYEKDDTEHVGWFWQPYEAGEPIWMKPYYNQNNDILMISYVIPMYYEETFIGVVGMDFDYTVLDDNVKGIKIYENGYAHLEQDGVIVSDGEQASEGKNHTDTSEYLRHSIDLLNGMTLVLSASHDDIRQIGYGITFKLLIAMLFLFTVFTVIVVIIVRKIVDPLKKLTDASVKISNGDYDVEIVQSDTYEIKLLSTAFENMITRLHEREERLRFSAYRDSLTGLRNTTSYAAWEEKLNKEIEGKNTEFGIVVLDLNGLKEVNDKHGHDVGNELILTAAKVMTEGFKNSPVFRIGGDEFLVILQNEELENRENLFSQFERICANTFIKADETKIPFRIANGFAKFDPCIDLHVTDVFKRADAAMYENKRKSKHL